MRRLLKSSFGQFSILTLIWIAIAGLGIVFVNVGIQTKTKMDFVKKWPSVTGVIQKTSVGIQEKFMGLGKDKTVPVVEYRYKVKKRSYEGNRIMVTEGPFKDVEKIDKGVRARIQIAPDAWTQRQWMEKDKIRVYYNPEMPKDSVLERRTARTYQKFYLIGVAALVFGIFMAGRGMLHEF